MWSKAETNRLGKLSKKRSSFARSLMNNGEISKAKQVVSSSFDSQVPRKCGNPSSSGFDARSLKFFGRQICRQYGLNV